MSRQANPKSKPQPAKPADGGGIRGFIDELIFICVIVMFFRMFVVELYKIPSGSDDADPAGGRIARVDVDGDGAKDLLFFDPSPPLGETQPLVYKWDAGATATCISAGCPPSTSTSSGTGDGPA